MDLNEQSLDVEDLSTEKIPFLTLNGSWMNGLAWTIIGRCGLENGKNTVITIKQRDEHDFTTKEFEFSQSMDVEDLSTEKIPFLTSYRFFNEWTWINNNWTLWTWERKKYRF